MSYSTRKSVGPFLRYGQKTAKKRPNLATRTQKLTFLPFCRPNFAKLAPSVCFSCNFTPDKYLMLLKKLFFRGQNYCRSFQEHLAIWAIQAILAIFRQCDLEKSVFILLQAKFCINASITVFFMQIYPMLKLKTNTKLLSKGPELLQKVKGIQVILTIFRQCKLKSSIFLNFAGQIL